MAAYFDGEVHTEWLRHHGDDRRMRLLAPFAFIDGGGFRWQALPDDVVDGASIPQILWSMAGSPFVGDYRRASVLHDVAIQRRERHGKPSKVVHRMFYEAMLADNVPRDTALKFYAAVRLFGPRWDVAPTGEFRVFAATPGVAPDLTIEEVEIVIDQVLGE